MTRLLGLFILFALLYIALRFAAWCIAEGARRFGRRAAELMTGWTEEGG